MKKLLESARRYYGWGSGARPEARRSAHRRGQRPAEDRPEEVSAEELPAGEAARAEDREATEAPAADPATGLVRQAPTTEDPRRLGREDWSKHQETIRPVAARSFSGRTLLMLLVAAVIVLPLPPTLQLYFSQKAEVTALEQEIERLRQEQEDLKEQQSLWKQDAYVEQQARDRLMYVRPGEVPFTVTGIDEEPPADDTSAEARTSARPSWTEQLLVSVMPDPESSATAEPSQGTDQ